jgi:hypothetical protein
MHGFRQRRQALEALRHHGDELETEQCLRAREDDAQFGQCLDDAGLQRLRLVLHRILLAMSGCQQRQAVPRGQGGQYKGRPCGARSSDAERPDAADGNVDTERAGQWQKRGAEPVRGMPDDEPGCVAAPGDVVQLRNGKQQRAGGEDQQ